jgi:hypothetical protein
MIKQTLDQLAIEMNTLSGITGRIDIALPIPCITDLYRDIYYNAPSRVCMPTLKDIGTCKTLHVYRSVNGIEFWIEPLFYDRSDKDLDRELDRMEREIVHYE